MNRCDDDSLKLQQQMLSISNYGRLQDQLLQAGHIKKQLQFPASHNILGGCPQVSNTTIASNEQAVPASSYAELMARQFCVSLRDEDDKKRYLNEQSSTRQRWCPTPNQIQLLESLYNTGLTTPSRDMIVEIASRLRSFGNISEANVFYWFQNRKSKAKRKQKFPNGSDEKDVCGRRKVSRTSASMARHTCHKCIEALKKDENREAPLFINDISCTTSKSSDCHSLDSLLLGTEMSLVEEQNMRKGSHMNADLIPNRVLLHRLLKHCTTFLSQEGRSSTSQQAAAWKANLPQLVNLQQMLLNQQANSPFASSGQPFPGSSICTITPSNVIDPTTYTNANNRRPITSLQGFEQMLHKGSLMTEAPSISSGQGIAPQPVAHPLALYATTLNCTLDNPILGIDQQAVHGTPATMNGGRTDLQLCEDQNECLSSWEFAVKQINQLV